MPGFVIDYNRRTGSCKVTEFDGPDGALKATQHRVKIEAGNQDPDREIVSIASSSLASVKRTHSRYFMREDQPALA